MIKNHRGGGNYLRVRGEYLSSFCYMFFESELPPRARRIRFEDATEGSTEGTTSACAENMLAELNLSEYERNYLRVRGEYASRTKLKRI